MIDFSVKYILFFVGILIFSLLINFIFLKFVRTLGIRNTQETVIRWNESSRPSIGGLSFYIIFLLSISTYSIGFNGHEAILSLREIGILVSCSLGFLMGLADDAYNTKPLLKSSTQVACGVILVLTGTQIELFENDIINAALTIVWVMGIMNSINMLDNMDGITGIVSLVISLTFLICLWVTNNTESIYFIITSGLVSGLTGFLFFNWYPSKMFMGDSGSQFLGALLSALGIIFLWNLEPLEPAQISFSKKLLFPLLAFIIPIVDTTTVVINRLSKRKSPFIGGKDHTTHNLARIGLSDSQVALAVMLLTLISALLIVTFYKESLSLGKIIFLSAYALAIMIGLFTVTQYKKEP